MRCPQCSRRNNDANRFCIFCAAPLHNKLDKKNKAIMPPQDIAESLKGRKNTILKRHNSINQQFNISPILGLVLLVALAILAGQYLIDNANIYEIQAIEANTNIDN